MSFHKNAIKTTDRYGVNDELADDWMVFFWVSK